MAMEDVTGSAARTRVDALGDRFGTTDGLEDPDERRRHGTFADHRDYHQQIGRWRSEHSRSLGILKADVNTRHRMQWGKSGAGRRQTPTDGAAFLAGVPCVVRDRSRPENRGTSTGWSP